MGLKDVGFKSFTKKLLPSMPERLSIHEVTVVPTLLPMMIGKTCLSCIMPLLTKQTIITVVAEED